MYVSGCEKQIGDEQKRKQCGENCLKPEQKSAACPRKDSFGRKKHKGKQKDDPKSGQCSFHQRFSVNQNKCYERYMKSVDFLCPL